MRLPAPTVLARTVLVGTVLVGAVVAGFGAPLAGLAQADPVVVVQLRHASDAAAEATVLLRDSAGAVSQCTTVQQTCEIHGAQPGPATVYARDAQGRQTTPRPVMIPPSGRVSLIVAAPS